MLSLSISEIIRGYVIDEESGNPIKNVNFISYPGNEFITKSNIDGHFYIELNSEHENLYFNPYWL